MKDFSYRWMLWLLVVGFSFFEMMLRVSPVLIVPQLGVISLGYFYAYAPLQIPVGILIDKYGARPILFKAALAMGVGGIVFALASSMWLAEIGKFFLGLGSMTAFITMLFVIAHCFERNKWVFLIAVSSSISLMGAVLGQGAFDYMLNVWGYRAVLLFIAIIAFGFAALFLRVGKYRPKSFHLDEGEERKVHFWPALKSIFSNSKVWLITLVSMGFMASVLSLGVSWGIPYLIASNRLSEEIASFATSMIFFGFAMGAPLMAHIADKFHKHREIMSVSLLLSFISVSSLVYLSPLADGAVFLLMFFIGFCSSAQVLTYPMGIEMAKPQLKATAVSLIYGMSFFLGALLQPLIGLLLKLISKGVVPYLVEGYRIAFTVLVVIQGVGFFASFLIPKTRNKQRAKQEEDLFEHAERRKAA